MGRNSGQIFYNESKTAAFIEYKHARSDYVAKLRLSLVDTGPDGGVKLATNVGSVIPADLILRAIDTMYAANPNYHRPIPEEDYVVS